MQDGDMVILRGPEDDLEEDQFRTGFCEDMYHLVGTVVEVKNLKYDEDGMPGCFDVQDDESGFIWSWDAMFADPCDKIGFTDDIDETEFNAVLD